MASVSGLAGFDGRSIVDQLMQVEAITKNKLATRVTGEQRVVSTLQSLNTALTKLAEQAAALAKPATWSALSATSSSTAVTATVRDGAAPANLSLTVEAVATSHQVAFNDPVRLDEQVLTGGVLTFTRDGVTTEISVADGTLAGVVDALNAQGEELGIRASAVRSGTGYNLMVESTTTGEAGRFTLGAPDGALLLENEATRDGQDARLSLGALTVTSATNTFTDLLPGVDVTVTAGALAPAGGSATPVTLTVASDPAALADKVKALVDATNAILTGIAGQTGYNSTTGVAGALLGDSTVNGLRNALAETIYPGDGTSLAALGIEVDRYGKMVFDAEKFTEAYAADPAAVAAGISGAAGFTGRVEKVAKAYSDPYEGSLTAAINGRNSAISRLEDSIEAWDVRLELRRATLTRQFTALEVALQRMSSQSEWLAGQLSSFTASTK